MDLRSSLPLYVIIFVFTVCIHMYIYMYVHVHVHVQVLAEDPSTYAVMMVGTGEKAFCAGGDIRG